MITLLMLKISLTAALVSIDQHRNIKYRKSLLPPQEFQTIKEEIGKKKALKTRLSKEKSSLAKNRLGAEISKKSKTYELIRNPDGAISKFINKRCNGKRMVLSEDLFSYFFYHHRIKLR